MGYDGQRVRVRIGFNENLACDPRGVGYLHFLATYIMDISGVAVSLVAERVRQEYRTQPMKLETAGRLLEALANTSLHARQVRVRAS